MQDKRTMSMKLNLKSNLKQPGSSRGVATFHEKIELSLTKNLCVCECKSPISP